MPYLVVEVSLECFERKLKLNYLPCTVSRVTPNFSRFLWLEFATDNCAPLSMSENYKAQGSASTCSKDTVKKRGLNIWVSGEHNHNGPEVE